MGSKTIYLIRHGETDYNKLGIVQGSGIDSNLNDTGRAQAKAFFEHYKDIPFQKIYTSALIRTHQSIELFLKKGLPHQILPELNEISWGYKEGKVPNSSDDKDYNELIQSWGKGKTDLKIRGGESPLEVAKRQERGLNHILQQKEENPILIAMHGRAMRILLTQLLNQPLSSMDQHEHTNLCLYVLEYSYITSQYQLLKANDRIHLETLTV
jgi:probable phosphoglycerate mutase